MPSTEVPPKVNTNFNAVHFQDEAHENRGEDETRTTQPGQTTTSPAGNRLDKQETEHDSDDNHHATAVETVKSAAHAAHASKQQSHDNHLTAVETVKSAAHAARQQLHLQDIKASGPAKFFNPTNVRVHVKWDDDDDPAARTSSHDSPSLGRIVGEKTLLWRSRDNRKGRNSVAVPAPSKTGPSFKAHLTARLQHTATNILRMFSVFAYWDMAFWSGWSYSIGSILFVMDGSWAWQDVAHPESVHENLVTYGGPLCFFIGTLLYQIGATMAYLEAVNDGSFQGSAMQRFLEGHEDASRKMVDEKIHHFFGHFDVAHLHHHHRHHRGEDDEEMVMQKAADAVDPEAGWNTKDRAERPGSIYPTGKGPAPRRGVVDFGEASEGTQTTYTTWRWFPTWHALKTHHVYEIGYVACAIQLFGATLYGITGIVVLPGILTSLKPWQEEAAFWVPQIVASTCFLTAGILFTLETQEKWWKPEPTTIGWWIGAWAVVGSIGFLLIACFGAASYDVEWGEYQADLGTIWGSGAYLTSSLLQWYEAMNKRPYQELLTERGDMKSWQIHPI